MGIFVIGLSHHTSPVTVRERFAFAEASIPTALDQLRTSGIAEEAVILSTCNRVELYIAADHNPRQAHEMLRRFLFEYHKYTDPVEDGVFYMHSESQSLEHLFKVACGLDSMVLGETEILGQLKKAYDTALAHKHTGGCLNKAFQKAFNVAKQIRTHTNIQRGSVSVGSVAVELAEKIFNSLAEREVMVIGAGDTSEKTARALMSRGAKSLFVANRTLERATALAAELGGRALHWDSWTTEAAHIDIIISSTAAPRYIITREKLEPVVRARRGRPLLLIDIAVPRDIDPEVNFLESVYLYNIDDLQAIAADHMRQRQEEIVRCETIIRENAREMLEALINRSLRTQPRPA